MAFLIFLSLVSAGMHYSLNWAKPWTIPKVIEATSQRKKEMEHMGAAYMAEGVVTLAGSRLYTSAAYTEEMIDDVLSRFENVFKNVTKLERPTHAHSKIS